MIRQILLFVGMMVMGSVLAACGASTRTAPASLPLDATQPTLFYFYTDN